MGSRKLTKKIFEQTLNEKGDLLAGMLDLDLSGMDDWFEGWKVQRYKKDFPKFGTWLRKAGHKQVVDDVNHTEFNVRYRRFVQTNA